MLLIGVILKPLGNDGTLFIENVIKDFPAIPKGNKIKIGYSINFSREFEIEYWKKAVKHSNVKLAGVDTIEQARLFGETGIFIDENQLEKIKSEIEPDNEFIGLKVYINDNSEYLGEVLEYWTLPANDVFLVRTENGDLPIPYINEVVSDIDFEKRIIIINMLDGLMDLIGKKND